MKATVEETKIRTLPAVRVTRRERQALELEARRLGLSLSDYTRQESRIIAKIPSAEIAAHLRQPINRPVLEVTSVNIDTFGVPIEFATTWFAGDRVNLMVRHDN